MVNFLKRLLIGVACFTPAFLTAYFCPVVQDLEVDINGWGWAWFFGLVIAGFFLRGFLAGAFKDFLGDDRKALAAGIDDTFGWLIMAGAFIATCAIVPALATYSSLAGVLTIAVVMAVCAGVDEYIIKRVGL
jgi:hypothetical protein